ncbi:MAG: hypothetical protein VR71_09980 [Roseovarius sp. BRH_c41]|nr:MAG: hypothetical protein VR71_09980 [Roseovarius sp. BRH_c41]
MSGDCNASDTKNGYSYAICRFGIEEGQVLSRPHRTRIKYTVKSFFLYKLAEILTWNVVSCGAAGQHRTSEFVAQTF